MDARGLGKAAAQLQGEQSNNLAGREQAGSMWPQCDRAVAPCGNLAKLIPWDQQIELQKYAAAIQLEPD